jgi:hypothetical protein
VGKRIKLPRREGFASFKPVLKSAASLELCTLFFWLVFAQRFRPDDKPLSTGLYDALAEKFVGLFRALNNSAAKVGPFRRRSEEWWPATVCPSTI